MTARINTLISKKIGLFFKNPRPGFVKTRLSPPLPPGAAAALYEAFLEDTIGTCLGVTEAELVLFDGSPGETWEKLPSNIPVVPQSGPDLGARMNRALEVLRAGGAREAVLVGSDIPTLPARLVQEALSLLGHQDVVLGPSHDGGFYLIGVSVPAGDLLDGIAWSSSSTLEETVRRIEDHGLTLGMLEPCLDVDTPEDLGALRQELTDFPTVAPATRVILSRIFPPG